MRLFLAIDLPEEVKNDLFDQLKDLREEYRDFRWTPPVNYHITLWFYGAVDEPQKKKIIEKIEKAIYDVKPFRLYSGTMNLFIKNNLVMYLGFAKSKAVEDLVKKIKEELNIHNDLKFFPHLMVARYRIPSKQQYLLIKKKLINKKIDIEFDIPQITLFDSVIENKKPVYKTVATFTLES